MKQAEIVQLTKNAIIEQVRNAGFRNSVTVEVTNKLGGNGWVGNNLSMTSGDLQQIIDDTLNTICKNIKKE